MASTLSVDLSRFNAALPRYVELSKQVSGDALNRKALYIARGAMDRTKRASRADIEKLGLVTASIRQRVDSRGRTRNVRKFDFQAEAAVANYAGALKRHGKTLRQFENRKAVEKAARKWISSKLKHIGFLASGWIRPVRQLASLVRGESFKPFTDARQYGVAKGYAIPASRNSDKPFVIIANTANRNRYGEPIPPHVSAMMLDALRRSVEAETNSTLEYIRRKMREAAAKSGFKTS